MTPFRRPSHQRHNRIPAMVHPYLPSCDCSASGASLDFEHRKRLARTTTLRGAAMFETKTIDYYEFLQISPNADSDTIHRVYRFLAARFHPDNPESGDPEKFFLLKEAYDVLSDPAKRSGYDVRRETQPAEKAPLSSTVDFMDDIKGELNRRLAVLAVLYYRRRTNPHSPEVGLSEIEKRMGFPRAYLDFTTC